jgi:hypothetical protein
MSPTVIAQNPRTSVYISGHLRMTLRSVIDGSIVRVTLRYRPHKFRAGSRRHTLLLIKARDVLEMHPLWGVAPFVIESIYHKPSGAVDFTFTDHVKEGKPWKR